MYQQHVWELLRKLSPVQQTISPCIKNQLLLKSGYAIPARRNWRTSWTLLFASNTCTDDSVKNIWLRRWSWVEFPCLINLRRSRTIRTVCDSLARKNFICFSSGWWLICWSVDTFKCLPTHNYGLVCLKFDRFSMQEALVQSIRTMQVLESETWSALRAVFDICTFVLM